MFPNMYFYLQSRGQYGNPQGGAAHPNDGVPVGLEHGDNGGRNGRRDRQCQIPPPPPARNPMVCGREPNGINIFQINIYIYLFKSMSTYMFTLHPKFLLLQYDSTI